MQTATLYLIPVSLAEGPADLVLPACVPATVKSLTHFAVEVPRTARRFISSLRLGLKIEDLIFHEVDKSTDARGIEAVINILKAGISVGVMSEAGCPGIADPGSVLVAAAHKQGIKVVPLVGPSSILLALMASGMNGQKFSFQGYLPVKPAERREALKKLEGVSAKENSTQIFIETPYRNQNMLADCINTLQGPTQLCVAVDLTGPEEEIISKEVGQWKNKSFDPGKRPAIFLLHAKR